MNGYLGDALVLAVQREVILELIDQQPHNSSCEELIFEKRCTHLFWLC